MGASGDAARGDGRAQPANHRGDARRRPRVSVLDDARWPIHTANGCAVIPHTQTEHRHGPPRSARTTGSNRSRRTTGRPMKRRRHVGVRVRRTTAVIGALMAGSVVACAPRAASTNSASVPSAWVLVWREEFDGPAGSPVDSTKWRHDLGDGCTVGICGWGNTEKEFYTNASENVALDGHGHLMIVARTTPSGLACYYGACRYTSAKITTHGRMLGGPGRVDARIKLPAGQGLWPAFWMLAASH